MGNIIWCWLTCSLSLERCTVGWYWWILNNRETLTHRRFSKVTSTGRVSTSSAGEVSLKLLVPAYLSGVDFLWNKVINCQIHAKGVGLLWNMKLMGTAFLFFFFYFKHRKHDWLLSCWNISETPCADTETLCFRKSYSAIALHISNAAFNVPGCKIYKAEPSWGALIKYLVLVLHFVTPNNPHLFSVVIQ